MIHPRKIILAMSQHSSVDTKLHLGEFAILGIIALSVFRYLMETHSMDAKTAIKGMYVHM